jgi:hypothetical protein
MPPPAPPRAAIALQERIYLATERPHKSLLPALTFRLSPPVSSS